MRPLAPRSEKLYRRLLSRAFGSADPPFFSREDLGQWPEPQKDLLRAAVKRAYGEDSTGAQAILHGIPRGYRIEKLARIPSEDDALKYEKAAAKLPKSLQAMAILPMALGFRAEELLALPREAVETAVRSGELVFIRKGGREHALRVAKSKEMLRALLKTPAKQRRHLDPPEEWRYAGELLGRGTIESQYQALYRLVARVCREAGIERFSPHKLRHIFGTRLNRDGASPFTVQYALNHKNIRTTQRYVHPGAADAEKFMREF